MALPGPPCEKLQGLPGLPCGPHGHPCRALFVKGLKASLDLPFQGFPLKAERPHWLSLGLPFKGLKASLGLSGSPWAFLGFPEKGLKAFLGLPLEERPQWLSLGFSGLPS